jgi:flagellar basal body P-ring protein FlgI
MHYSTHFVLSTVQHHITVQRIRILASYSADENALIGYTLDP